MRKLCPSLRLGRFLRSSIVSLISVFALVLICQSAALGQTITLDSPASHSTSTYGQPLTISGTVTPADGWTVVVYDGQKYLGSAIVSGGTYNFTTRLLSSGYHALWVYGVNAGTVRQAAPVMHTITAEPSSGFAPAVSYAVDGGAAALAVADFDGNGTSDLYVACGVTLVTPLIGAPDGTFTKGTQLTVGTDLRSIAAGDLNKDGLMDFVATSLTDNTIKVYIANGSGGWNTQSLSTDTGPVDVVTADFNVDANLDIAVANRTANDVSIFIGDGAGNFASKVDFPNAVGMLPSSIAVMNYNGDSYPDIVLASEGPGATPLSVLPSTGPVTYGAAVPYGGGNWGADVADVNQNGREDVVSIERGAPSYVYIALGDTLSNLTTIHSYSTPDNTGRFAIADIDGDGNLDIAMVVESTNSVRVLYGDGTGAFGGARDFAVGNTPVAVKAGDFNGDGRTDLAVANKGDSTVSILLGQGPDLSITKTLPYHPHQGETGVQYTITVTNHGEGPTVGTVTVVDNFPATGMTATGFSGTGWGCSLATLTCSRTDALAPGGAYEPITLTVDVAIDAATGILNTATVSGGGDLDTGDNTAYNSATIIQVADLAIYMEHAPSTFVVGEMATFTIGVQNNGPSPTWGLVRVINTLPAGLTATAISGTGWTCDLPTLTCDRNDDPIAVGAFYPDINLTVTVGAGARPSVINTATVQSGGDYTIPNNTVSATVTVNPAGGPDMFVQKYHAPGTNFYKGQTGAMYTLDVYNNGGANSSGAVIVADSFPAGITFNSFGPLATGWSCNNTATSISCDTLNAIPPGPISPGITVYVDVAPNATSVVNVATISGGSDVDTTNNQSNDPTTIVDVPTTTTVAGSGYWGATTFTATVTPVLPPGVTVSGTPSGMVTFREGATTLGTATLNSGQAVFSTSAMSIGPHTISVDYPADTQFAASTGTITFDVPGAPTTVTATGGTVTYPATSVIPVAVTSSVGTPTGNIEVSFNGGAPTPYTLSASGTYDVNFIFHPGAYNVTITYPAQGNYATSTRTVTVNVNQAATTTVLTAAPNPAPVSTSVTFTATVTGPIGGVTPTGTVTFLDGATSIGTGTLNASGVATLTTSTLTTGNHSITAVYAGDGDYLTSTSAAVAQTIGRPQVTFPSGSSSLTVVAGQFGRVTLNVGATGTLTGPVTFVCSGLPAGSTCAFNPSTVGPTMPASTSVTIQTTGFRIVGSNRHSNLGMTFAMLIPGMLLIPAAFKRHRRLAIVLGLIAIAALMLGLTGCGTASQPGITNGANATPAGTYVVTITGSSTGADPGTTTINLTVTQ